MPHSLQTKIQVHPKGVVEDIRRFAAANDLRVELYDSGTKANPLIMLRAFYRSYTEALPLISFIQAFSWFAEYNEDGILKELDRQPSMVVAEGGRTIATYCITYLFYLPPAPECPLWNNLEGEDNGTN